MRLRQPWPLLLAFATTGCVATQDEVRTLSGRLAYLESRVEKTEDLAQEASGSARQEALESRREISDRLTEVRAQVAEATARLQGLEQDVQRLQGSQTQAEADLPQLRNQLLRVEERLNALEGATRSRASAGGDGTPDPAAFRWSNEREGYAEAKKSFDARDWDRARLQFRELLRRWPDGRYAPNSLFWLGEIDYTQRDWINAIDRYLQVVEQHPRSQKASSAYYKMALALLELGEKDKAKRTLEDLLHLYPKSEQAEPARKALAQLG